MKKKSNLFQTNKIVGKDWLKYHPNTSPTDNYYIVLCNKVLKIIQKPGIAIFLNEADDEKELACMLVSYFEDVISETRLFSSFTRQHKQMYGKELPFYEFTDEYYDDEINLYDIYFLIWYYLSVGVENYVIDPLFEGDKAFFKSVLEIYNLFESEFEKAPQNENLQQFLQLSAGSNVETVRGKLTFIACHSYLWHAFFDDFFHDVINKYKKNETVVLDEKSEMDIYDQRVLFIFNICMPLLSMRANEYYAAILGEEHSEYQFIKNISKRIMGCFLLLKIESDGYLIEHLTSKKQIWLSNEYTAFEDIKLIENETVLYISLVEWTKDVWQNQGGCIMLKIDEMKGKDLSKHLFEDEGRNLEILQEYEKAFLDITNGKRIVYLRGVHEYADFYIKMSRIHAENTKKTVTDNELDEKYNTIIETHKKNKPFEKDEPVGIFFNPYRGMETFRERLVSGMSDQSNPHYANKVIDVCNLLTVKAFSKEFINYAIDNKLINLGVDEFESPKMFDVVMKNLDFLLRFYRLSDYFPKPVIGVSE